MAYEKQTWQTGETITAQKLNHIEDGITSAQVYSVSEDVRFSGSVTTEKHEGINGANIDCDLFDAPDQINVVFDGTEYTCEKVVFSGIIVYGGFGDGGYDFSEYPFAIVVVGERNIVQLATETAGSHQVEITAIAKSVNEDLADLIPVMRLVNGITNSADALSAFNAGKLLYFTHQDGFYIVTGIDNEMSRFIAIPDSAECSFGGDTISISTK